MLKVLRTHIICFPGAFHAVVVALHNIRGEQLVGKIECLGKMQELGLS